MGVELRHLRALAAIGDKGSITAAAAVVGVSQPALSRTLEQLEQLLGTVLVERTTGSLRLTDAGRRFWQHAHQILHHLEEAVHETASGPRPLRVGFASAALGRHTIPLLRQWDRDHPDTALQLRRVDDPDTALRRGEIDMAFLRSLPDDDAFYAVPLLKEPRLAAIAEDDPLSAGRTVSLASLAQRTIALCSTAGTTTLQLWPTNPPARHTVANVDEWLTAIAAGQAVGVTAEATGHAHPYPGVRYLPIVDAEPVAVHLAWNPRPTHPAATEFREHAQRVIGRTA